MKKLFLLGILFLILPNVKALELNLAPNAKSAILVENSTGKILFEKNINEKLPPASMTKIASMLIVMEEIAKGNLKLTDQVTISENAARMGGSQIFLSPGESYSVEDLLKGVAIASGNDVAVTKKQYLESSKEIYQN